MVAELFRDFEKAMDATPKRRRRPWTCHVCIQEEHFYPTARQAMPETEDHVLEGIEEHHVMVWMLSEDPRADAERAASGAAPAL